MWVGVKDDRELGVCICIWIEQLEKFGEDGPFWNELNKFVGCFFIGMCMVMLQDLNARLSNEVTERIIESRVYRILKGELNIQ